jgi:hypothetical protein
LAKHTYVQLSLEQHHKIEKKNKNKNPLGQMMKKSLQKIPLFCTGNGIFFLMKDSKATLQNS